jgi:prepilin-type N-terminal cleavage/methylation domain-containing protein
MTATHFRDDRGFTLTELMLVVAIGLIVLGMSIGGIQGMLKTSRADSGLIQLATGIRNARELSVAARRNVQVTFGTNTIMATKIDVGGATILLRTTTLEGRNKFQQPPSTVTTDTPDAFGNTDTSGINLGTKTPAMFTTDGSLINQDGDIINGSIFIGIPGDPLSIRAVTIFGPTGAMRLWKWDGRKWVEA